MQRRHRLKKSAEFQRVRALKRSWAHPLLVLYVAPNDLEITRVGISVSKRIGKAVVRNRVKRLIREAVRGYLPSLPGGQDLVFIARAAAAESSYERISDAVAKLLGRAGLLVRRKPAAQESERAASETGPSPTPTARKPDQTKDEVDSTVSD